MARLIVLDASVLIAHFDSVDTNHQRAQDLLSKHLAEALGASPITLAEVLVGPARRGHLDLALSALRLLGVATVALDQESPRNLARLRAGTGLRLPDCCVLLAADSKAATVATFDRQLASAARELTLTVLGQ